MARAKETHIYNKDTGLFLSALKFGPLVCSGGPTLLDAGSMMWVGKS